MVEDVGPVAGDRVSATFRARLRHLMQTVAAPSGGTYSFRELAAAIKAKGFDGPSAAYLNQLATGARTDPKMSHVLGIAAALGVPSAYFFEDDVAEHIDDRMAAEHGRAGDERLPDDVQLIAYRAGELSDRGRRQVMELLEVVHRFEQQDAARGVAERE